MCPVSSGDKVLLDLRVDKAQANVSKMSSIFRLMQLQANLLIPQLSTASFHGRIYRPREYQGLKSKTRMWKTGEHMCVTPPSPTWTCGEKGDTPGGSGSCR